jgi:DNA repair exonuclease SbcCD ATPase subunit/DNA repair exonuclease SbcCD nuclease subunit
MQINKISKIEIGFDKIGKIYHLADIHLRNLKRHGEYKTVFQRTIAAIKETIVQGDIIFLGGDIVHAKTDMTPELVQSVQEFLKMFADLAPTILITGNHDANLNNKSRLDALTPIVNALEHPNLIYLKDSGIYQIADKHFVVMSVFDKPKDFIKASDFEGTCKIALHHGAVNQASTDAGFQLTNEHVNTATFDGFQLTLLGDIHKPAQYLNEAKTIAYCGSLIQQSHSESLIHGMLIWDTSTFESTFIPISNDFCYFTVDVINGQYNELPATIADKKIRLRVRSKNTDSADVKKILAIIKATHKIEEFTVQKINDLTSTGNRISKINVGDVRDIEYQNSLITKYLDNKFALSEEVLDGIRQLNRTINSGLPKTEVARNIHWIPKRFEFSNMFSYGENNVIDFSDLKGVYGIFAPNASGKSTMLDSLTYCIFDKCSRTSKAVNVLNMKATSFSCKFQFELYGKQYFIEKKGSRGRGGHVRVDIDFYMLDDVGQQESLNGKERSDTNDSIRSILGTYDDFILTALSIQGNNSGFIDMAQRERKDLLAQFLDINIFDELYNVASLEIKEVATLVKENQRQDYSTKLADAERRIQLYQVAYNDHLSKKNVLSQKLEDLTSEILKHTEKLIPIDVQVRELVDIQKEFDSVQELIRKNKLSIADNEEKINLLQEENSNIQKDIQDIDIDTLLKDRESLLKKERDINSEVDKLKLIVKHKLEKMEKLSSLEYDENCSFCMDNIFVKDAIETKESIEKDKDLARSLLERLKLLVEEIHATDHVIDLKIKLDDSKARLAKNLSIQQSIQHEISSKHIALVKLESKSKDLDIELTNYNSRAAAISHNKILNESIKLLTSEKLSLKKDLEDIDRQVSSSYSNLNLAMREKESNMESISKLKELIKLNQFYQYYLEAINRDGVPYDLIATTIPFIEQEINNILSQLVDFNLIIEMDGKNINCYIAYDTDRFWPIELTSGMEKFISSLAIRTALINISSLPRPNFLAIDEGLGSLDATYLSDFGTFLSYLESQFTFIIMISHIENSKDIVTNTIEINKINGSSNVYHV